jgi:hypothetical protein
LNVSVAMSNTVLPWSHTVNHRRGSFTRLAQPPSAIPARSARLPGTE